MSERLQHMLSELADPEAEADAGAQLGEAARALLAEADASDEEALTALGHLRGLVVPERSRSRGLALCRELKRLTRGRAHGFRIETLEITIGITRRPLDVVLIPSVFEPEEWGTTFLEGLLRKPADEYAGRVLVELGCGSGWISIALGKFTDLQRIHGLDINPHAPLVSEVNAILNSYDERGAPIYDADRRLLYEKTAFRTSDLLSAFRERGERADIIIGSIPQVPRPDLGPVTAETDARTLYDLSNYTQVQGVYEDRHGLGLIAHALDQAVPCLEAGGQVVFNLAGRPGTRVIERMFTKRGYAPRVIWRSRSQQAADTDISELGELERRTGVDFEFYLRKTSLEPISARTAVSWRAAGGELWHDLLVYEATLRHPRERLALDAALERMGMSDLGRNIDLSTTGGPQLSFALRVARALHRRSRIPYVHEQGSQGLREKLAAYLDKFWGLGTSDDELFLGPTRQATVFALLSALVDPQDTVLLGNDLAELYGPALARAGVVALIANSALDEVVELARGLRPRLVLLRAAAAERRNVRALEALAELGCPVVFDETDELRLLPELYKNELFEFLATRPRGRLLVIAALRDPAIYPELELALVLGPPQLVHKLAAAGEAAYCRISHLAELFITHLVEQALAFHISLGRGQPEAEAPARTGAAEPPRLSARIQMLARLPAFADAGAPEPDRDVIRLDYGENEYPVPRRLVAGVLAGLLEPPQPGLEAALRQAAAAYLAETRGATAGAEDIAVGAGCIPLLAQLCAALQERLGRAPRVVVPSGYYGIFPGVLTLAGGLLRVAPSTAERRFKLLPEDIGDADIALVTHPGNPTGVYYREEELGALAAAAPLLVVDEIYGLLDGREPPAGWFSAARLGGPRVAVLFGLSKEFAAGGLRVGFVACGDHALLELTRSRALTGADRFAMRAAEHLLAVYRRDEIGAPVDPRGRAEVEGYLAGLRQHLGEQRSKLVEALGTLGIQCEGEAGLFLLAAVGDDERFSELLRTGAHLLVNSGAWAGVSGYVRLVYSLDSRRVDEAADRLRRLAGQRFLR
jgi:aspartate/methionine/tyrosine aminotransferase/methylase of polypeptide subunit release factors